MSAEQTAERTRRPRSPNGDAVFLVQAKADNGDWVELGALTVPGGTRRMPMRGRTDGSSVIERAVQEWPEEFNDGEQVTLRVLRLRDPEKDLAEHTVGVKVQPQVVIG